MSSVQIPMGSRLSNGTPALVLDDLNLMEGLTLKKATKTVKRVFRCGLVEAKDPSMPKQLYGTQGKKSKSQPSSEEHGSKDKVDGVDGPSSGP